MQMMKKPGTTPALKLFKPKESELRKQHREMSQNQSQDQSDEQDQELEDEQGNAICCCGAPGCRIGPFVPDNRPKAW